MSKNDDDILANELAKFGARGGGIGGGNAGKLGGWLGGQLSAKFLPNNVYEISLDVVTQPASVLSLATSVLNAEGKLLGTEEISGTFEVKGLIGAGFLNMNPAIVTVLITAVSNYQTHVTIQGKAKEGLIKQHAGEKAAERIAQQLTARLK